MGGTLYDPNYYGRRYEGYENPDALIGIVVDVLNPKVTKGADPAAPAPEGKFIYKVKLCTGNSESTSNDQTISVNPPGIALKPSGQGGLHNPGGVIPPGTLVRVLYNKRSKGYEMVGVVSPVGAGVQLSQRDTAKICAARSSFSYRSGQFSLQIPLSNQGENGGPANNELDGNQVPDKEKWDKLYLSIPPIELKSPCEPSSMAGMPSMMSDMMGSIQDLRTGLLGDDSFLVTSGEFVNEVQGKVDGMASMMAGAMSWLVQEIKRQIMRKVNFAVNASVGNLYLNLRYQIFEGVDKSLAAMACIFSALLDTLAQYLADALNNFINDVINPVTCAIENFLSDLLGQIANGILNAVSGILSSIGSIIGQAIGVIDSVLSVIETLLNMFDGCAPTQICPADKEWNFLEGVGGAGGSPIDIGAIMSRVNSSISAFSGLADSITTLPDRFSAFDFGLDPASALASAGGCFVGPIPCGPPTVRFFGGGATVSATGLPIVSASGRVMGISLTSSGFGYTSPPMVVIDDPCGTGTGARATVGIGTTTTSAGGRSGGRRKTYPPGPPPVGSPLTTGGGIPSTPTTSSSASVTPSTPTTTRTATTTATPTTTRTATSTITTSATVTTSVTATTSTTVTTTRTLTTPPTFLPPAVPAGTPARGGSFGPLRAGGSGGVPVTVGGRGGVIVTAGGLAVRAGSTGGLPLVAGGSRVVGSDVSVGGFGGTDLRANAIGGTPVTAGGLPVISGGSGGTIVTVAGSTSSIPPSSSSASSSSVASSASTPSPTGGIGDECEYLLASGYNGPGIYLDLSTISSLSTVSVTFTVSSKTPGGPYSVTIPSVGTFNAVTSGVSYNLTGGRIYGPCTFTRGTLYIGNFAVDGVVGSGSLPNTSIVIEDGGDDWDDFVITTNRGIFVDLVDCNPSPTVVGVTTVIMLSTGYGYLPAPDGSRGANGRIYGDRCQTLVQRAVGTWDQPYNPGDSITLETGDRIALPGMGEIELGDSKLPKELSAIGAYIVRINPPLVVTNRFRSMVGFEDSKGTVSTNVRRIRNFNTEFYGEGIGFGRADLLGARGQGFTDAEIRYFLENDFTGEIGPAVKALLANPDWGKIPPSTSNTSGENWFSMEDYQEARRQGFEDGDIRFYLEKNYTGRISPRVQNLLNDPTFGTVVRSDVRSMVGFDDAGSGSTPGQFGYERDYPYARSLGYSDVDIRYYLENVYKGEIGPAMRERLADPSWGRSPQAGYVGVREMFSFDDSTGSLENGRGHFGYLTDYQEARRQGYTDADIRYYLENHYTGTLGPRMIEALNDPNFGRIQGVNNMAGAEYGNLRDMTGFSDAYGTAAGVFGEADYQEARRQGYSDADVRNYLQNFYTGTIGPRVRARLNDPAWGRRITDSGFVDTPGAAGGFGELDYEQATRENLNDDQFLANAGDDNTSRIYENFRQQGFSDADVRYYLENYYTGRIGPRMQARLDDPNWGRTFPTIPGQNTTAPTRIRDMTRFLDRPGRRDEFSTADLDEARRLGFRDIDVRFYLENNYTGYIADPIRRLLSDPSWGRLGQTITVALSAPGCPDDPVIDEFIASDIVFVPRLSDVVIADPGFRYDCSVDTIEVVPDRGARLEYECVNGSISNIRVIDGGSGFTEMPEIRINTETGNNLRVLPVLAFDPPAADVGVGVTFIRVVDCVGTIPPRRPLDIVPD